MTEVAGVMNRLIVHSDDYVPRAKTGFVGSAAFLHRTDQDPIPIFHSEKFTQLRSDVLHHQTATRRGMHHHDRSGYIEIGQIGDGRDFDGAGVPPAGRNSRRDA